MQNGVGPEAELAAAAARAADAYDLDDEHLPSELLHAAADELAIDEELTAAQAVVRFMSSAELEQTLLSERESDEQPAAAEAANGAPSAFAGTSEAGTERVGGATVRELDAIAGGRDAR